MKYVVGQKLWMVPSDSGSGGPREVTVVKVGRKWASISGYGPTSRIDDCGRIDGGEYMSPGQCHEDRAAYEAGVALRLAWMALRQRMYDTWATPAGMTIERIQQAAELLGIELGEREQHEDHIKRDAVLRIRERIAERESMRVY